MEKTYKILKLLIWVLLFAVLMVGAYVLYNRLSAQMEPAQLATEATAGETEAAPNPAPDFTFYDSEGNAHKLSDFRGKPVLLNFWASWCGPCKMIAPIVDELCQTRSDLKVCKVNVDDEPALASQFGVSSIPTLVVIRNGEVAHQSSGARPKNQIIALLEG